MRRQHPKIVTFASLLALLALSSLARSFQRAPAPDFAAAREEVARILSGFIRIDTSNPPGNETRGAEYLKAILDRERIPSEIFEMEPGRGNIVARIKGTGSKKPLLLMGHIDVVGVEREKWTVEPFGAVIKDGYLYGRGASDDKGMASACLEVFLLLHRLKVPLDRDIIFLAEAGEEGTSTVGIDYMVAQHWDKIECEYALNEGGMIYAPEERLSTSASQLLRKYREVSGLWREEQAGMARFLDRTTRSPILPPRLQKSATGSPLCG